MIGEGSFWRNKIHNKKLLFVLDSAIVVVIFSYLVTQRFSNIPSYYYFVEFLHWSWGEAHSWVNIVVRPLTPLIFYK